MSNCIEAFQQFVQHIRQKNIAMLAIQKASQQYLLKAYDISGITVESAKQMFQSIQEKFYKKKTQSLGINWFQNQLRIFVWTLVCYIYDKQVKIENLNHDDWKYFSTIFMWKDPKLFDYQCHSIYLSPQKTHLWVKDEDEILFNIIKQKEQRAKWNEVSKQLFQISDNKFFRTPKQCRQRWNNHLDPKKIKGSWKIYECLKMFEFVLAEGKKWAKLVKILDNSRDQHSIKNKFNSLYKKQSKMSPGYIQHQIYQLIIKRLKKAQNPQDNSKYGDTSFDINDMDQQNYDQLPRSALFSNYQHLATSSYAQKLRRKLLNFNSEPKKASIGTQACIQNKRVQQSPNMLPQSRSNQLRRVPVVSVASSPYQNYVRRNNNECSDEQQQKQQNMMGQQWHQRSSLGLHNQLQLQQQDEILSRQQQQQYQQQIDRYQHNNSKNNNNNKYSGSLIDYQSQSHGNYPKKQ